MEDCRAYRGGITGNIDSTVHTLVRARLKLHQSALQEIQPHRTLDVSKLQITANVRTLSRANTCKPSEIEKMVA